MELEPDNYRGPYHLGYLYAFTEGREDEGLAMYRKAMELAPEEYGVRAEYGRVLLAMGRLADAEQAFLDLIEVAGESAFAYTCLGYVELQKENPDKGKAREWYAKGVGRMEADEADPSEYIFAYFDLARLAAEAGDTATALECMGALVHVDVINFRDAFATDPAFEAVRADAGYAQIMSHADEHFRQYVDEYCTVPPGEKAPDFKLHDLDGNKVKLKDLKGQLVLLNVWATWCGPCRVEIPDFSAIYEEYQGKGVAVLGMSTDDLSAEDMREAAEALGATYPIVMADENTARKYIEKSGSIPETYFIGPDGRVLDFIVGTTNRQTLEYKIKKYLS
jgi:peroxiredoxin